MGAGIMTMSFAFDLFGQTLRTPRAAAERILALNLSREWLWMALILMGVLNGIVYSLFLQIGPAPDPETLSLIPTALRSPALFTMLLLGVLVFTVLSLTWVGQALGGRAQVTQVLALIAWLQALRLVVQLALLVLMLTVPSAGLLLVTIASIWGLVILIVFIDRAHGFDNGFKAVAVVILAFLGMVAGLSAILSVLATLVMGGA